MSVIEWDKNLYFSKIKKFKIENISFNETDYIKINKEIDNYLFLEFSKTYSKKLNIFNGAKNELITYQSIKTANLIYNKKESILIINSNKVFSEYILKFLKKNKIIDFELIKLNFQKILNTLESDFKINPLNIKVKNFELNPRYICDAELKTKSNSYLKELIENKKEITYLKLNIEKNEIILEYPSILKIPNLNLDFFYFINLIIENSK